MKSNTFAVHPNHPASNGSAEQTFKKALKNIPKTYSKHFLNLFLTYRSTPHTITNETPAKLFLNHKLQINATREEHCCWCLSKTKTES